MIEADICYTSDTISGHKIVYCINHISPNSLPENDWYSTLEFTEE